MRSKKVINKVVSLMFAVVMMVGIFSAVSPQQAQAAAKTKSFKSTGKSAVTIKDSECLDSEERIKPHWIKFRAGVTGYITVHVTKASKDFYSYGYINLCNSKKEVMGEGYDYWDTSCAWNDRKTKTYGVKKGQTYYFRVYCASGAKFSATVKEVKKSTANSIRKAKNIAKKKQVSGVMIAGEKKADWYKIKLTKRQVVKLTYSAKTDSEGVKISFCSSNGGVYANSHGGLQEDRVNSLYPSRGMRCSTASYANKPGVRWCEPGTYYVKVEPYSKTASGYYTLKWQ